MEKNTFDLFRVLIAVAEARNFREAAERLQISQPAVSLKLRQLEETQPLPLFSLEGKRKVLTRYGRSLYELAKSGSLELERSVENLHRVYSSARNLTVRLGGRNEVLEYVAPRLDFEGKIECIGVSSREAVEKLRRHEIDIALTYLRPDSTEFIAKRLFQSKVHFTVNKKHLGKRALDRDTVRDHDFLRQTPCIFYTRDGHLIREWADHSGLDLAALNVKFVAEDWRTIQYLVEQGAGFAILPSYVIVSSPHVHQLELHGQDLGALDFYAIYESSLKKIDAFKELLSFANF
jgi:DNA-binding transcriptional LysR family regulator